MTSPRTELSLRADMAQWPQALALVEAFCVQHGVARDDALRLALVAEELFTNVVEHGHAGGADAPVRVELALAPGRLEFFIEDAAPAFDPLARAPGADAGADPDPDRIGGRGLLIVRALAAGARYERAQGFNRLWVTLAIDAPPAAGQGPVLPR